MVCQYEPVPREFKMKQSIAEKVEDFEVTASLFRALCNSTSFKIALELRYAERSLSSLAAKMGVRPEELFGPISTMVQQRVVDSRRRGEGIRYSLKHPETAQALDLVRYISERRLSMELSGRCHTETGAKRTANHSKDS